MNFEHSPRSRDLAERLTAFMEEHIYPNEAAYAEALIPMIAGRVAPAK